MFAFIKNTKIRARIAMALMLPVLGLIIFSGISMQEIARNVEQASVGTQDVSSNIASVNKAADDTGSAANNVLEAVDVLGGESNKLSHEVEEFLQGIKAA